MEDGDLTPGSVRIGDEKVPIEVLSITDHEKKANIEFSPYKEIKQNIPAPDEQFMSRLILGISQNDYESARTYKTTNLSQKCGFHASDSASFRAVFSKSC